LLLNKVVALSIVRRRENSANLFKSLLETRDGTVVLEVLFGESNYQLANRARALLESALNRSNLLDRRTQTSLGAEGLRVLVVDDPVDERR